MDMDGQHGMSESALKTQEQRRQLRVGSGWLGNEMNNNNNNYYYYNYNKNNNSNNNNNNNNNSSGSSTCRDHSHSKLLACGHEIVQVLRPGLCKFVHTQQSPTIQLQRILTSRLA